MRGILYLRQLEEVVRPARSVHGRSSPRFWRNGNHHEEEGGSNGVASIQGTVSVGTGRELGPNIFSLGFKPSVRWEARDRTNGKITGNRCQMEISFPGTDKATYRTANCATYMHVTNAPRYDKPGIYSIKILDRVSGRSSTNTFTA
jgi:hypothetical protein